MELHGLMGAAASSTWRSMSHKRVIARKAPGRVSQTSTEPVPDVLMYLGRNVPKLVLYSGMGVRRQASAGSLPSPHGLHAPSVVRYMPHINPSSAFMLACSFLDPLVYAPEHRTEVMLTRASDASTLRLTFVEYYSGSLVLTAVTIASLSSYSTAEINRC